MKKTTHKITPPIRCMVTDATGRALKYDPDTKRLSFVSWKDFTEFPSKHAATSACWHTKEYERENGKAVGVYKIEPV